MSIFPGGNQLIFPENLNPQLTGQTCLYMHDCGAPVMTGKTFCDQHNCLWSRCINARAIMRELPANIPPGFCEVHKCQILACQAPKMLRSEVHPPKIAQDKLMQKGLNTAELLYHALANTGPTTQFLQVLRAIKDIATYCREHQCKEDPACEEYVMDRGSFCPLHGGKYKYEPPVADPGEDRNERGHRRHHHVPHRRRHRHRHHYRD
ncbi:hypothetical protein BKA67DRAFT_560456 [Truncatella angustata]|uniref:Uncharacterized protein n=1 Tax=Truncatella angustata TaxID=152316 RepID=A0A9P8UN78_9PEZI|nr:uncharacterized protein BKA67DRAFT_560456 [Truncatella angustata]KAH6655366.1 hypothetical protein BKA67DRAFT_560456 [Truncatella angustata]